MKSKVPFLYRMTIYKKEENGKAYAYVHLVTDYKNGYSTGEYYYKHMKFELIREYSKNLIFPSSYTLGYYHKDRKHIKEFRGGYSIKEAFSEAQRHISIYPYLF